MSSKTPMEFAETQKISVSRLGSAIFNFRNLLIVLAILLGGGGGVAAIDFLSKGDVEKIVEGKLTTERLKADFRYQQIDTVVQKQGKDIGVIKKNVDDIQTVQRKSISRQEARRLTSGIKNRGNRERDYDRLFELNMRRLQKGLDPCLTVKCGGD